MAELVVSMALQTFKDLLLDEGKFLAGVEGEAKELEFQLKDIQGLLEDADRKKQNSVMVQRWIGEIRDLAYRAEDTIASYAVRNSSETQSRGLKRLLSRLKSNAVSCFSLHELGQEISEIKSDLERVSKSMRDNGIIKRITDEAETSSPANQDEDWARKTFPNFEIGDCFVGKKKDLERLCSLVRDDKQHRVISVWGMGGIGKSTIVKQVYNRMKQTKNFDCFAWVCITQQCQIRTVLESVFKQLNPKKEEGISSLSREELIGKLCQLQRFKRCLIVVDDLWEVSHWVGLKHAFVVEDLKSKILMTTRNQNVANIGFSVELGLLNKDEALELLQKKSIPQGNFPDFAFEESFHKIGEEMVKKCGYLPLAISLLGGVLSKKSSVAEWEDVNSNIDSSIYGGEGCDNKGNQIEQVLRLSYQDLPYYLKPCFLLLARWKEGKLISTLQLYWLWIGQGMISYRNVKQKEETLLETAEFYLNELASRSLVKLEDDYGSTPLVKYKFCRLHDKVRELCVSIGTNEKYGVLISEYTGGKFSTLPQEDNRTRHLVMNFKEKLQLVDVDPVAMASGEGSKHLRSLEIQNDMLPEFPCPAQSIVDLKKFKMLKSLIISNFKFKNGKFPSGITKLIHLKNLCLEYCEFDELPSSIGSLVYLEYLSLCGSWNVRIPDELNKLSQLKHLNLPPYDATTIGNYRMRLDVSDTLEFLEGFDSSVHELESITRMKNLRTFSAISRDNESLSTIRNIIATEWKKLRYCKVSIEKGCELRSEEGKKQLKQVLACPNLYNLAIEVPLCKRPAEFGSDIISSKLLCLNLKNCGIEDNPLVMLGKLATLKELTLSGSSFAGEELICPVGSFPSLRKLKLAYLPNWRELRVENGAMLLLREIHMKRCPNLKKIPDGLSCISTLQHLTITGIPELARRVKESGEDFHKVCNIPSVFTRD